MTATTSLVASALRDRFVRGGDRAYIASLGQLLSRTYKTDAHFVAYAAEERLTRKSLADGKATAMTAIVFDVDCQEVHGTSAPAPAEWRSAFDAKMSKLAECHPRPFAYHTRGGARVMYVLKPYRIESAQDARRWSQDYAVALTYLLRAFAIAADPACHDFTRLFRLPHATREPGGRPQNWPTFGDPFDIGTFRLEPTREDIETAKASSKAFQPSRIADYTPSTVSGEGLLFHLLRARGHVIRAHREEGAYVIRCPREDVHSSGRTGDGSTLLYPPARGEQVGAVHCLHAHCTDMTVRDWVRCFSATEIEAARVAAGIGRAA
ncbi:MAG: hypothetical protein WBG86_16390 [Polyangiales bacterium]